MTVPAGRRGLLICDDLFFGTKVTGTARALGLRVDEVPTVAALTEAVREEPRPSLVLIDLALAGPVADVTAVLPEEGRPHVVAFGSHVDTARLQEALDAGCDDVLPRSRFTTELPTILRTHL